MISKNSKYLHILISTSASTANLGSGFDSLAIGLDLWNHYHMTINLKDELSKDIKQYNIEISKDSYQTPNMFNIEKNYFTRTFSHFVEKFSQYHVCKNKQRPIDVYQTNYIPHERGLGSSSSACVAGIKAAIIYMKEVYDIDIKNNDKLIDNDDIASFARDQDSCQDNVCACLAGGLTMVFMNEKSDDKGLHDSSGKLNFFRYPIDDNDLRFILIIPKFLSKTTELRVPLAKMNYKIEHVVFNLTRAICIPEIFKNKRYDLLKEAVKDKVHQKPRSSLLYLPKGDTPYKTPILNDIFKKSYEYGSYATFVSGAGSSIAIISNKNRAKDIKNKMSYYLNDIMDLESIRILKPTNEGIKHTTFYSDINQPECT